LKINLIKFCLLVLSFVKYKSYDEVFSKSMIKITYTAFTAFISVSHIMKKRYS
jgi:hypothetical protein